MTVPLDPAHTHLATNHKLKRSGYPMDDAMDLELISGIAHQRAGVGGFPVLVDN